MGIESYILKGDNLYHRRAFYDAGCTTMCKRERGCGAIFFSEEGCDRHLCIDFRPLQEGVDVVNHPPHYNSHPSGVETIVITEHMSFCLGNVLKYVMRAEHKGKLLEDLKKAQWYLTREIALVESKKSPSTS